MEASKSTSMNKALFSNGESSAAAATAASAEESGWTIYFEDFFASEKRDCTASNSIDGVSSSLVSDAASCAAWNLPAAAATASRREKLSFKKRKARGGVLDDDPLEDTASSPVNSPKVSEMNPLSLDQRKKDETNISQKKDNIVGFENCTEVRREDMDGLGLVDGANECTELKKRGLCLVPLSILVDYLG